MMNYLFAAFMIIGVVAGGITGTMDDVLQNIFDFAQAGVDIALGLIGIMTFFCGLMKVMEDSGLCEKIGKAIAPLMRLLFPEVPADHPANSAMQHHVEQYGEIHNLSDDGWIGICDFNFIVHIDSPRLCLIVSIKY